MIKKLIKISLILFLFISFISSLSAQRQTGSIHGTIIDTESNPLPGVTVTISSEALMGTQSYITTETGAYRFPAVPPGTYTIEAEMPGFKKVIRGEIVVRVGMVVTIDITLEQATVQEELTVTAPSPTVDVESTKVVMTMDQELLNNIPTSRDIYDIVNAAPGAISENVIYRRTSSIHGGSVAGNTYAFDGVYINEPRVNYAMTNVNFDVMEEVEMITASQTADVGFTEGGYINIVTRSGGNKFSGGATLYYQSEGMVQQLWRDEQIQAMGVAKPAVHTRWLDGSLYLGGPLLKDKLWFFSNVHYIKEEATTNFIPFTDILGRYHGPYDYMHEEQMGFIKLTSQLTSKIKAMAMFNYVMRYSPSFLTFGQPVPYTSFEATRPWDHEKDYTPTVNLSYILNQNTFFDLKVGYAYRFFPATLQEEVKDLPWIRDYATPYTSLTNDSSGNQTTTPWRIAFGTSFTHFKDNLLGGNHEFKGGLEFEYAYSNENYWRKDNLYWYWNNGPYYYGRKTWKGVESVGYGRTDFSVYGPEEDSSKPEVNSKRISAYIQDSLTLKRLTLNVGFRFDRSWGSRPAITKAAGGNPISVYVGEKYVKPYVASTYPQSFPQGLNPFAEITFPEWTNIMVWTNFSPRIGLTYDLFGNNKTALKASYSRYSDSLMHSLLPSQFDIFTRFRFDWYDMNFNAVLDTDDDYVLYPADVRVMDPEFAKKQLDPNASSPITDEITAGLWQELFKDFSLGANFIYKLRKNVIGQKLYSPDTDEEWYNIDEAAAQKYWVPFTAIVPGSDNFPTETVTFYARKNNAPLLFYRKTNIPELRRKYWAFELLFNKRMSSGWQFAGSVVYSKAYGNFGGMYGDTQGGTSVDPNFFVNRDGRTNIDRPLVVKLMGTARLPLDILLSGYYRYISGAPWTRSASIIPPASWCTANNAYRDYYTVLIEPAGSRRNTAQSILDMRFEKEFLVGNLGRLGFYVDIFNILGWSNVTVGMSDIWRYAPSAENISEPKNVSLNSTYKRISAVEGLREVKLSLRFRF